MESGDKQREIEASKAQTFLQPEEATRLGSSAQVKPLLLIVDEPEFHSQEQLDTIREMLQAFDNALPLHVMAFVDGGLNELRDHLRSLRRGPVVVINASNYLDQVGFKVRALACSFTADLRSQFETLAEDVPGPAFAECFGDLWWYTEVSEKNSPGTPPWWNLVHGAAVETATHVRKWPPPVCHDIVFLVV